MEAIVRSVMVSEKGTDLVLTEVPSLLAGMPEKTRNDILWWWAVSAAMHDNDDRLLLGPPRDITYNIVTTPEDLDAVHFREVTGAHAGETENFLAKVREQLDGAKTFCVIQYDLESMIKLPPP